MMADTKEQVIIIQDQQAADDEQAQAKLALEKESQKQIEAESMEKAVKKNLEEITAIALKELE